MLLEICSPNRQNRFNFFIDSSLYLYHFLGYNGVIKGTITFREKLPAEEFIDTVLIKMTQELSTDYATGKRIIADQPTITINSWREASLWLKNARYIKGENCAEFSQFFVASSQFNSDENFDLNYVKQLSNIESYKSLRSYERQRYHKFWTVSLNKNESWKLGSSCDCPAFLKNYKCKHVTGLALGNNLCKLPKKALTTEIKKIANKKGRSAKATPAFHK